MPSVAQAMTQQNTTNGGEKVRLLTLDHLDGRTTAARRARALIEELESDMGGADRLSTAERQIVQRAAILGALVEAAEAQALAGHTVSVQELISMIGAQQRLLMSLGLQRRPRDVTPDLKEYAARRHLSGEETE